MEVLNDALIAQQLYEEELQCMNDEHIAGMYHEIDKQHMYERLKKLQIVSFNVLFQLSLRLLFSHYVLLEYFISYLNSHFNACIFIYLLLYFLITSYKHILQSHDNRRKRSIL